MPACPCASAVIVVGPPTLVVVAKPSELIVRNVVGEALQLTRGQFGHVLPSESVAVTVNFCVFPLMMVVGSA